MLTAAVCDSHDLLPDPLNPSPTSHSHCLTRVTSIPDPTQPLNLHNLVIEKSQPSEAVGTGPFYR